MDWIPCNAAEVYQNQLNVSRAFVAHIMKELDPVGVDARRRRTLRRRLYYSKGPNWVWQLDGYDKLKPFGFEIHGCFDGYSRRVLRLNVLRSNKDPKEVCNLFINYMTVMKGVPRKIVADRGTENVSKQVLKDFSEGTTRMIWLGTGVFYSGSLLPIKE